MYHIYLIVYPKTSCSYSYFQRKRNCFRWINWYFCRIKIKIPNDFLYFERIFNFSFSKILQNIEIKLIFVLGCLITYLFSIQILPFTSNLINWKSSFYFQFKNTRVLSTVLIQIYFSQRSERLLFILERSSYRRVKQESR